MSTVNKRLNTRTPKTPKPGNLQYEAEFRRGATYLGGLTLLFIPAIMWMATGATG